MNTFMDSRITLNLNAFSPKALARFASEIANRMDDLVMEEGNPPVSTNEMDDLAGDLSDLYQMIKKIEGSDGAFQLLEEAGTHPMALDYAVDDDHLPDWYLELPAQVA